MTKLIRNCAELEPFIVERIYLCGRNLCDVTDMQLHGFSDASAKAYACAIYLRILFNNGGVFTTFVASKSCVAPIKKITIPRLELIACVILSCLMNTVIRSLTDYVISIVANFFKNKCGRFFHVVILSAKRTISSAPAEETISWGFEGRFEPLKGVQGRSPW